MEEKVLGFGAIEISRSDPSTAFGYRLTSLRMTTPGEELRTQKLTPKTQHLTY